MVRSARRPRRRRTRRRRPRTWQRRTWPARPDRTGARPGPPASRRRPDRHGVDRDVLAVGARHEGARAVAVGRDRERDRVAVVGQLQRQGNARGVGHPVQARHHRVGVGLQALRLVLDPPEQRPAAGDRQLR